MHGETKGGDCYVAGGTHAMPVGLDWLLGEEGEGGGAGLEPAGCDSCVLVRAQHVWPSPEMPGVKPT